MHENEDVILTEFGEVMTYGEAVSTHTLIERKATTEETKEYENECEYWRKQGEQEQHDGSYHELPD
jgi:hypothetical protein